VSGELDLATAGQLEHAFREALGSARLVLLDMHEVTFMDSTGLRAIMNATASARAQGGHVLSGVSAEVEGMLDLTGTRALLNVLGLPPRAKVDAARRRRSEDDRIRALDNPVNARVLTARVMAISETRLWIQAADGVIHRSGRHRPIHFRCRAAPRSRSTSTPRAPSTAGTSPTPAWRSISGDSARTSHRRRTRTSPARDRAGSSGKLPPRAAWQSVRSNA
jgi:anti-sigma B factor antagonist